MLLVNNNYRRGDKVFSTTKLRFNILNDLDINATRLSMAKEDLSEQDLVELTALGGFNSVVVDYYVAKYFSDNYDNLKILKAQSKNLLPGSWVVRKDSENLLSELNQFLPSISAGSFLGNFIDLKFKSSYTNLKNKKEFKSSKKISPFDQLLKKYAAQYDFHWPVLAALAFQESRFNQKLVSSAGAVGVFQVKPTTAKEPYINIKKIKGENYLENNIHAGVKYLDWILRNYFKNKQSISSKDKLRFTFAAYNAGLQLLRKLPR